MLFTKYSKWSTLIISFSLHSSPLVHEKIEAQRKLGNLLKPNLVASEGIEI